MTRPSIDEMQDALEHIDALLNMLRWHIGEYFSAEYIRAPLANFRHVLESEISDIERKKLSQWQNSVNAKDK